MTLPNYAVKPSGIHGQGLFAARWLDAGESVVEYTGERIDKAESARRLAVDRMVFIFALDEEFDVDGSSPANPARFANHSCEPNLELRKLPVALQFAENPGWRRTLLRLRICQVWQARALPLRSRAM